MEARCSVFNMTFKVRIVGGGIAGLSLAHSLLRFARKPIDVKVFEKSSDYYAQNGAALELALNGILCLSFLRILNFKL